MLWSGVEMAGAVEGPRWDLFLVKLGYCPGSALEKKVAGTMLLRVEHRVRCVICRRLNVVILSTSCLGAPLSRYAGRPELGPNGGRRNDASSARCRIGRCPVNHRTWGASGALLDAHGTPHEDGRRGSPSQFTTSSLLDFRR